MEITDRDAIGKDGYLRVADWGDVDLLFSWANDKEVRKNSFSSEPICYEEHLAWFRKKYQERDSQIGRAHV